MIKFIDKIISDILFSVYDEVKDKAELIAKNKFGLKKYLSNLKSDLDQVYLHRSNTKQEISKLFVDLKLIDTVLSERYIIDSTIQSALLQSGIRNPKILLRKEIQSEIEYKTKEQILSNYSRIILLGQPGSGKSTTIKKIILDKINSQNLEQIPLFIPLRSPKLNEFTITKFIKFQFEKYGIKEPKELIENLLKKGKFFIAIDGIDEVAKENRQNIIDQILNLSTEFPKNTIVASSRLADYQGELNRFKEVELCEFSKNDIETFIQNWFNSFTNQIDIKPLLNNIREYPQIREIATSPLLLSLICVVYQHDLEISSRRTTLYKRCVECLLRDWDAQRNFRRKSSYSKLDDPKKIMLLSELAYRLHNDHKIYFDNSLLKNYLESSVEKYGLEKTSIYDVIKEIKSHYGFIIEVSKDVYSFSHLTFQEYFTANFIVANGIWKEEVNKHLENNFWQEVFILSSSLFANSSEYIQYIYQKKSTRKKQLLLSALCLSVDPIVDKELKKTIVRKILYEYHNYKNKEIHEKCLFVISRIDDTFVGKELLNSLGVNRKYLEKTRKEN
ncbi:NACHT domain-containing protein [uncultured Maribacter sp.]|uniref:NACHT domain-containing protein n=1 Tax=uncultured Maribacter sp. TaxID=431308 RepID=UPI0030ECCC45|tara:strand:- start:4635 stop:6311 length:1677 start_codon:yes stop_codon:yes gene_type:complete